MYALNIISQKTTHLSAKTRLELEDVVASVAVVDKRVEHGARGDAEQEEKQ